MIVECMAMTRNGSGKITGLSFNRAASLGVGRSMEVTNIATVFSVRNAQNTKLIGAIIGDYDDSVFGDLTPNRVRKENGCDAGVDGAAGG